MVWQIHGFSNNWGQSKLNHNGVPSHCIQTTLVFFKHSTFMLQGKNQHLKFVRLSTDIHQGIYQDPFLIQHERQL